MKYSLLLFSILFLSLYSFGQNIIIVDSDGNDIIGDTIFVDAILDPDDAFQVFEKKGVATIINGSNNTMTIALTRYEEEIVPGTGDAVCWGSTCYGEVKNRPIWEIEDTVRIFSGDTAGGILGGFVSYHHPNQKSGNSTYRYKFFDKNSPFFSSDIFIQYRVEDITSINEVLLKSNSISLYPNPAKDAVNISLDPSIQNSVDKIVIKNLIGTTVKEILLENYSENISIDLSELKTSIYFLGVQMNDGNLLVKKLIKNN